MPKKRPALPETNRGDTTEPAAFLGGLHLEYVEQVQKYLRLTADLMGLQARVELAEKTVQITRDHLALMIQRTEGVLPRDWETTLKQSQFVGVRLSDACSDLLREHKQLTPTQLLNGLNNGQYRFKTNTPLREIHGALLKQPWVTRQGDRYIWIGGTEQQMAMRLKAVEEEAEKAS